MGPAHHILTLRCWIRVAAQRARQARTCDGSAAARHRADSDFLRASCRDALASARKWPWCPDCHGRGLRGFGDARLLTPGALNLSGAPCSLCRGTGSYSPRSS